MSDRRIPPSQYQRDADRQYLANKSTLRQFYANTGDKDTSWEVLNWDRDKINDHVYAMTGVRSL